MSPQQVATAAVASMTAAQTNAASAGDNFLQGVNTAMRMYTELQSSETGYKKLTGIPKGALLGFCGVTSWKDIHPIWTKIEATKNEANLQRILDKEWGKHASDLNLMHYKVYWTDELLSSIRTVEFTESGKATFLTSEMGLSVLQMMPRTAAEEDNFKKERRVRAKSNETLTYSEAKRFERAPRLPPGTWEETAALLTTYSLFLEMLFGLNNEHRRGVDEVRQTLMSLADVKSKLTPPLKIDSEY